MIHTLISKIGEETLSLPGLTLLISEDKNNSLSCAPRGKLPGTDSQHLPKLEANMEQEMYKKVLICMVRATQLLWLWSSSRNIKVLICMVPGNELDIYRVKILLNKIYIKKKNSN